MVVKVYVEFFYLGGYFVLYYFCPFFEFVLFVVVVVPYFFSVAVEADVCEV